MRSGPDVADILDNLHDGVYFVDRDRKITYWNKGAERLTGYPSQAVVGISCGDGILNHVDEQGRPMCGELCPLSGTMSDGEPREAEVFQHHADGHRMPVVVRCAPLRGADGEIVGAVESFARDRGNRTRRAELRELREAVRTDALTGIGNRSFIEGRLRATVAEYASQHPAAAVVMVDIDHFKSVNDSHGHAVGDDALRMVATTLRSNVRGTDSVGRWGGEEFLLVLDGLQSAADLERVCEKLRRLVGWSALPLDEGTLSVTISLGATMLAVGDTPASLVERADGLLYRSKHEGRDRVTVG